jgi:hypothetical protein
MNRRTLLQSFGTAWLAKALPAVAQVQRPVPAVSIAGSGPAILTFGRDPQFFEPLTGGYRVVTLSYQIDDVSTPDEVCADMLAAADAAGVARFVWYGYSISAVVGLQLATRTDRLTALICGGWPPLGAPYRDMPKVSSTLFYRQLASWPERDAVSRIVCPRFAFAGDQDTIPTPEFTARLGPTLTEHRAELERMGWVVKLVAGQDHQLGQRPELVMSLVREFLDGLSLR